MLLSPHFCAQASDFSWAIEDLITRSESDPLFTLFTNELRPPFYWDDDEKRQVKELLGYLPKQSIWISSGCNQDEDHTTLGQLVLHLARVYDGLTDMEGAITPPLKPVNREVQEKKP